MCTSIGIIVITDLLEIQAWCVVLYVWEICTYVFTLVIWADCKVHVSQGQMPGNIDRWPSYVSAVNTTFAEVGDFSIVYNFARHKGLKLFKINLYVNFVPPKKVAWNWISYTCMHTYTYSYIMLEARFASIKYTWIAV